MSYEEIVRLLKDFEKYDKLHSGHIKGMYKDKLQRFNDYVAKRKLSLDALSNIIRDVLGNSRATTNATIEEEEIIRLDKNIRYYFKRTIAAPVFYQNNNERSINE